MSIFKNHRHKTNIALAAFTSLFAVGVAVVFSTPYLLSILEPITVFGAILLEMGIFAFVAAAVTLVGLAIYPIIKNNEISEPKAPSIVIRSNKGDLFAKVKDEDFEYIKTHTKNKNQDGSVISDEYRIDFNFESNSYYITAAGKEMDNNDVLLRINSVGRKNDKGEYELIHKDKEKLKTLGLGAEENDAKELIIRLLPRSIFKSLEVKHEEPEKLLNNQV